jgi:zinc transporter ZupT
LEAAFGFLSRALLRMDVNGLTVTFAAFVTALATGLGAVPFFFVQRIARRRLGLANGAAAGLMLAASLMLVYEGGTRGMAKMTLGAALGVVAIAASRRFLGGEEDVAIGQLRGADALEALMIVGVMTAHSFAEGVGVGVSYGEGNVLGVFITTAISVHNIPEGLAISLVLVPRGVSAWRAAGWSIFSSLPQPIMALPAFLFVQVFRPFLPVGLGFAAGAMTWMVARELVPEALEDADPVPVALAVVLAAAAMMAFQLLVLSR